MIDKSKKLQLSEKVVTIPEALSVYMNTVVYAMRRRGDDIKVLSLGEAYFDIPMYSFEALDFTRGYHYSESRGMPELRQIIADYYQKHYSAGIDPENEILISAGSKPLIYMAFQAVLNAGDEVLIHEPAWLSYQEEIKLADGIPCFIPYDCPVADFPRYFTDKTRIVVINNPNNPAGRIYTKEELELLYSLCRPRGIYILVDEAYSDFVVDQPFTSMINIVPDKDGIIVVNSLSKNMGISGWRIGYVVSTPEVIFQILKLNQHLITCPATILCMYLIKYFDDFMRVTLPQAQEVVKKRAAVVDFMKSIGLSPMEGSGTFYTFVSIDGYGHSSLDLAYYLLMKYHIAVVPGSAYGESTGRFIRIGIGTESMESLQASLRIIKRVLEQDEFDPQLIDRELKSLNMNRFVNAQSAQPGK